MLFTVLIWTLLLLVYISNRNNKTNLWCVIAGLFMSMGTFKEFFYFELRDILSAHHVPAPSDTFFDLTYSIMTALLYFFTMPFVVIFALHFNSYTVNHPKTYRKLVPLLFVPAAVLACFFNPMRINEFQHDSRVFWYSFTAYNLLYGIFTAVLMISAVLTKPSKAPRRQKRLVSVIILPPIWFWLISIFVFHSINLQPLFKVWHGNQYLLFFSVAFYVIAAFREGMMGIRLRQEHYQWDTDLKITTRGTQYTSHIIKNELTKIEWSINNLQKRLNENAPAELAIIDRATQHLRQFVDKTQLFSDDILLLERSCCVMELIDKALQSMREYMGFEIVYTVDCPPDEYLVCDEQHVSETLRNLLANAVDAMDSSGNISVAYSSQINHKYNILSIQDYGKGIAKQQIPLIFEPFYTTKKTNSHFGLGLAYCTNVMKKHGGYIDVVSEEGQGSTFSLCFPKKKRGHHMPKPHA